MALLSHPLELTKSERRALAGAAESSANKEALARPDGIPQNAGRRLPPGVAPRRSAENNRNRVPPAQKKLQDMMKQIEEEEKAQIVRLGDASIAAPFTSKYSSIQSSTL